MQHPCRLNQIMGNVFWGLNQQLRLTIVVPKPRANTVIGINNLNRRWPREIFSAPVIGWFYLSHMVVWNEMKQFKS